MVHHRVNPKPSSALENFVWDLVPSSKDDLYEVMAKALRPWSLDEKGILRSFYIGALHEVSDGTFINLTGLSKSRLKLFLAKYLVLAYLFIFKPRENFHRYIFWRLTCYLRYYHAILDDFQKGYLQSFDFWWSTESTYLFLEHSNSRILRPNGPLSELEVISENKVEWLLTNVLAHENLALVPHLELQKSSKHVEDWIELEVIRVVGEDYKSNDRFLTYYGQWYIIRNFHLLLNSYIMYSIWRK